MKFKTIETSDPRFESDGLRYLTVKSPSLKGRADLSLYIPPSAVNETDLPVIVLLHGVYGSHWAWTKKAGVHLTLQKLIAQKILKPFVLAMPSDGLWGDGSGYVPHAHQDFENWIGLEIPELLTQEVKQVSTSSSFYIAGLSMGGYGAFRIGSLFKNRFNGISAHSSVMDIRNLIDFVEEGWNFWDAKSNVNSVLEILQSVNGPWPPIRFDCGLADDLLEANRSLHQSLVALGIDHSYQEFPGGHEWSYWENHVVETLRFFHGLENG